MFRSRYLGHLEEHTEPLLKPQREGGIIQPLINASVLISLMLMSKRGIGFGARINVLSGPGQARRSVTALRVTRLQQRLTNPPSAPLPSPLHSPPPRSNIVKRDPRHFVTIDCGAMMHGY